MEEGRFSSLLHPDMCPKLLLQPMYFIFAFSRMSILGGALVTFVAGLLSAFAPNYISLLILRGLAGAGLGSGHVFFSWFMEFVPPSNRGKWMVVFSTFWTFGSVSEAALAWVCFYP